MPPKPAANPAKKPDKKDAKELEALRLAEEARLAEEQRLREEEEAKRREVIELPNGLSLYINAYCMQEAWTSPNPKEFLYEFVSRVLKDKDISENFLPSDIRLLAEFHLYNLIYAKEDLKLDDTKAMVLLNIFWRLIMNNNPLYERKLDLDKYDNAARDKLFRQKTKRGDLEEFKRVLTNHCIEAAPQKAGYFSDEEAQKILGYAQRSYFMYYSLYKYALFNKQKEQDQKIFVHVNVPLPQLPLFAASYTGKEKEDHDKEAEERQKRELEEMRRMEEEHRLRMEEIERKIKEEEDNRLDPKTLAIIQAKLKETEEQLQKQLEDREKHLGEKLESLNPKKKK